MLKKCENLRCEIMSWPKAAREARKLSWLIQASHYSPDIVVAIGRGGYVPARILCDYLSINELTALKVEHWAGAGLKKKKAIVKFPLNTKIRGKKVLLVDDLTDTGETLKITIAYLKRFLPKEIRTAVLLHKTCSAIVPDYFVRKITKWRWVIFPWHLWEDLTAFIKKLGATGITSIDNLSDELQDKYKISVRPDIIKEIMLHMK